MSASLLPQPGVTIEELSVASSQESIDSARELLLEYGQFVQSKSVGAAFCFGTLQSEAANLPGSYQNQGGGFLLARLSGLPVGVFAWRSLPSDENAGESWLDLRTAWEVKRLWIRQSARGHGVGKLMVESVIERGRLAGKTRLLLDTVPQGMEAAYRLYQSLGFVECASYNGGSPRGVVYMRKEL